MFSFQEEFREIWQYPLFLSEFNRILIFSTGFFLKYSNTKFHKNPLEVADLLHESGQMKGRTDRHNDA
jgi:hypothetical protein